MRLTLDEDERLKAKLIKDPSGCRIWSSTVNSNGVPVVTIRGVTYAVRTVLATVQARWAATQHDCQTRECVLRKNRLARSIAPRSA